MSPPNAQPNLPAEGVVKDIEAVFISEQPQRLFPTNQNSNFGALRKTITDELQIAVDLLGELFNELFINSTSGYIGRWEDEMGLPRGTNWPLSHRRILVSSRRRRGPFTRARRRELVEQFITDTFGSPTEFTAAGIPLTGAGVPMYTEYAVVTSLYTITEDAAFHYVVNIDPAVTPDLTGLTRELNWITPSGYSFAITQV